MGQGGLQHLPARPLWTSRGGELKQQHHGSPGCASGARGDRLQVWVFDVKTHAGRAGCQRVLSPAQIDAGTSEYVVKGITQKQSPHQVSHREAKGGRAGGTVGLSVGPGRG